MKLHGCNLLKVGKKSLLMWARLCSLRQTFNYLSNSLLQKSETIKPNNCQRGIFACKNQERVSKDEIDFEVHNLQNPKSFCCTFPHHSVEKR